MTRVLSIAACLYNLMIISRLNPGIKKRDNSFFCDQFFISKNGYNSVNHAGSRDTKLLGPFPGNFDFEIFAKFCEIAWMALICVGV